jgi:sugar lactone lactonase YvrE
MQTQLSYPLLFEAEVHNSLGESIIWDARRGVFLWTDILESKLFSLDYSSRGIQVWDLPYRAGSLGLTEDPEILVVAFEQGIALLSLDDGEIEWLFQPSLAEGIRFNDGRVSPDGLFCAGTMNELDEQSEDVLGALYRVDSEGNHQTLVEHVGVSNGLCWSPDGASMYFADSPKQTISCYRYLANGGAVSDKSTFAQTSNEEFPDGAI